MSLYLRGSIWWAYVTVNGQRIRQSTGQTNERKAQEVHDKIKYSAKQARDDGYTLNDALKLWLKASPRSETDKSAIHVFLQSYPSRPLSKIDGHNILDTFKSIKPSTYNRMANVIRAAINMAESRKWCEPIKIYRKKILPPKRRYLTHQEWQRLYSELPDHIKPMAKFAIATGLRQSNVLNLQWHQVDIEKAIAWVEASETKAKKAIAIPLSKDAIDALNTQIGKHKHFVFTYNEKPVTSVKTAFNKALIRANIHLVKIGVDNNNKDVFKSAFRWHDLRHTWASWHVQNGTPLAVLKELGGWSSIEMVLTYAHFNPNHLKDYANNSVAQNVS